MSCLIHPWVSITRMRLTDVFVHLFTGTQTNTPFLCSLRCHALGEFAVHDFANSAARFWSNSSAGFLSNSSAWFEPLYLPIIEEKLADRVAHFGFRGVGKSPAFQRKLGSQFLAEAPKPFKTKGLHTYVESVAPPIPHDLTGKCLRKLPRSLFPMVPIFLQNLAGFWRKLLKQNPPKVGQGFGRNTGNKNPRGPEGIPFRHEPL